MDVALPTLDGLEAARRIAKVAPLCSILMVSNERDTAVIREAFKAGRAVTS